MMVPCQGNPEENPRRYITITLHMALLVSVAGWAGAQETADPVLAQAYADARDR